MAMENIIHVVGNLTRDPELKYTTSGRGVANGSVACSRRWKDKSDTWQEETTFVNFVAWGELAENIAASLTQGSRVIVIGRLELRSYDDREGNKKYVTEIIAEHVGPDLRFATVEVERIERDKAPRQDRTQSQDRTQPDEEPFLMLADVSDVEAVSGYGRRILVRPWN